jgi:hypothetical protein
MPVQTKASLGEVADVRPAEASPPPAAMASSVVESVGDQGAAVGQVGAALAEGVAEVGQREAGVGAHVVRQLLRGGHQGVLAARRDRQDGR